MQVIIGLVVAVLVFGVMIFLHELGHYLVARACRVTVTEFAVGMGPKLFSHTSKKTGIVYSLRLLPIGGFTAMEGEDGESADPHALVNRPRYQRFLVLFAGSFMNIVSGILAMLLYLSLTLQVGTNVVAEFRENSLSDKTGLSVGDKIVAINGETMVSYNDILYKIMLDGTEPLEIEVKRDDNSVTLSGVTFPTDEEEGVEYGVCDFLFLGAKPTVKTLLTQTFTQSAAAVKAIYKSLFQIVSGKFGIRGVSGPVGTVSVISKAAQTDFASVLYLFVFISLNLGVMNLLPLPALDGGRIMFLLIEAIRRKPVPPKAETLVHVIGLIALLAFMAFITVFDVLKLIQ